MTLGTTYRYDVRTTDADGDTLTYALNQAAIDRGMAIDNRGRIIWTPKATDLTNPVPIVVTVTDTQGAIVTQSVNLQIVADTEAPNVIECHDEYSECRSDCDSSTHTVHQRLISPASEGQ